MTWEAVIGLEVHAQLLTATKMFCRCRNRFGDPPNTNVCPVCLGLPGSLPVPNEAALAMAVRTALALGCTVHAASEFSRKNYFYPDLPKNYQISQYDRPLATDGVLEFRLDGEVRRVRIRRLHIEEDAGKSLHEGFSDSDRYTYLDFNRCGAPLMEIVSEPDIRSPKEAAAYLRKLRQVLLYLGVCDGNMEQGSLRCDANVSVRRPGDPLPDYKVELKNLNSFKFLQKALEYEIERQVRVLEAGGTLVQETRLWDERNQRTEVMRTKEEAHDYRYFPDPDLLEVRLDPAWVEDLRRTLPELPDRRMDRFMRQYQLPAYDAELLTANPQVADYFEAAVQTGASPKAVANWILSELFRYMDFETGLPPATVPPAHLGQLVRMVQERVITGPVAKEVLGIMLETGRDPAAIVQERGWQVTQDEAQIRRWVEEVLQEHPEQVEQYRAGRTKLLGFFMGQVMRKAGGKADPQRVQALLQERLQALASTPSDR